MNIDIPDETLTRTYHIRYEASPGEVEHVKRFVVYLQSGFPPELRPALANKLQVKLQEIDFANEQNDTLNYTEKGERVQYDMDSEHKEKHAKALVTQYLSSLGLDTELTALLTGLVNQQKVVFLNQSAWASAPQGRGGGPQAAEGITSTVPRGQRFVSINEQNHTLNAIVHELFHTIQSDALTNLPGGVVAGMTEYFTLQASGLDFRLARDSSKPVHDDSVRVLRRALDTGAVTHEQLVQGYFQGTTGPLDRLGPDEDTKRTATLGDFPGKTVNFVWIGLNPVNALGAFNAASWLLCGWNVNVFRHVPPGGKPGPTFGGNLDKLVDLAASAGNASFREIALSDVVMGDASKVMPLTAEVIVPWLTTELHGHLPYVLGDISKAFIAGTQYGIVLDTKIGPSRWVNQYPSAPFQKFICASRLGGTVVENQCMGSFALESSYAYARVYDPRPASFLKGLDLGSVGQAQSIFGGLTQMHQGSYSALARKAAALDIIKHDVPWPPLPFVVPPNLRKEPPYTFTELPVASWKVTFQDENELKRFIDLNGRAGPQNSRGPFRVYQVAGYYNWSQGEYAQQKMSNDASVARTLVLEHVDKGGQGKPDPFKSFEEHYTIVGDMVSAVIASLSIWREDKKN